VIVHHDQLNVICILLNMDKKNLDQVANDEPKAQVQATNDALFC
jgi:hypothetical protein